MMLLIIATGMAGFGGFFLLGTLAGVSTPYQGARLRVYLCLLGSLLGGGGLTTAFCLALVAGLPLGTSAAIATATMLLAILVGMRVTDIRQQADDADDQ